MEYIEGIRETFYFIINTYGQWWYLVVGAIVMVMSIDTWGRYIRNKYFRDMDFTFLSVNVPTDLEKSPKFMEQFFSSCFGLQAKGTWSDQFWRGRQQVYLSLEIVGIGGQVRFIIRVPTNFRDFIEANLYAEYPEAEINEVADYTESIDIRRLDNREYSAFFAEQELVKPDPIPIMTYRDFEHSMTQTMLDPIANIAEIMTSLYPGEQAWIQLLVAPEKDEWVKEGKDFVAKTMQRPQPEASIIPKIPLVSELLEETQDILRQAAEAPFGDPAPAEKPKEERPQRPFFFASPGETAMLEAIERNLTKPGFRSRLRFGYIAEKDVDRGDAIVSAMFGVYWQFQMQGLNGFRPSKKHWTKIDYFLPRYRSHYRLKNIFRRYIERDFTRGVPPYILTTEELATVYHFPSITVQAPNLDRIESKKSEAPPNLPVV